MYHDLKAIRFISGTKISHDYRGREVNTFSLRELISKKVDSIGVPAKQNRLLIVDVDVAGPSHQHDGRQWWQNFCQEYGIPDTYTVQTPSGGYHFYFRIPDSIDLETFACPAHPQENGESVLGVDFKYNGWVGSPPTKGYYVIHKDISQIEELPVVFLAYISNITQGQSISTNANNPVANLHRPYTAEQIEDLQSKINWVRSNTTLSRDEWRDGIFSLKAGIEDPALLEDLVVKWTMNKSYIDGDEKLAIDMADRADKYGSIGPGTIFSIIKDAMTRSGEAIKIDSASAEQSPWTRDEIFARAQVPVHVNRKGEDVVEPSESNAAALLGALYDINSLYYDTRNNMYIFNDESYSDTELANRFIPLIQSSSHGLGLDKFRASTVQRGIDILMANRKVDPHERYLKSLQWDGVHRIETFFIDFLKVQDTAYHRRVGKNFWTALAARGLCAGCKFDSMLVIEGHEGIRKSSLVQVIGGKEYTYAPLSNKAFEDLDELRKMHQSVIVELPELIGLVNRPAEMVKGFLSNPVDTIRDLFAKRAKQNKRGFVCVGTTNESKYLNSAMGIRRFWPIVCPSDLQSIDTVEISRIRDQLFAEAVAWYRDGYEYWDMPSNLLGQEVNGKIQEDPLKTAISKCVFDGEHFDILDLFKRLADLGYVNRGFDYRLAERFETALKSLGFMEVGGMWSKPTTESQPEFLAQFTNLI